MEKHVKKLFPIFYTASCCRCGCQILLEKCYKVDGYSVNNHRLPGATYCKQCAHNRNMAIELLEEHYVKQRWVLKEWIK